MANHIFIRYSLLAVLSFSLKSTYGQEIVIHRLAYSEDCTTGYLSVNGSIICHTLELPWRDNIGSISCIPSGSYKAFIRYDKKDKWRIQLLDVPNRSGVQIHIGNFPREIEGCVLVGTSVNIDECTLSDSIIAYDKLKQSCFFTNGQSLNVTIVGGQN